MNSLLSLLQPYPFERLKQLFAEVTLPANYSAISLGMGEPRHPTPQFIKDTLCSHLEGLASYPATAGDIRLRTAFTEWIRRRYQLDLNPATQVLPDSTAGPTRACRHACARTATPTHHRFSTTTILRLRCVPMQTEHGNPVPPRPSNPRRSRNMAPAFVPFRPSGPNVEPSSPSTTHRQDRPGWSMR